MKQINLSQAEIREIVLQPSTGVISVSYQVKDDLGNVVYAKTTSLKVSDLPAAGQTAVSNLSSKLLDRVLAQEGL